jgi:hypothetical protein
MQFGSALQRLLQRLAYCNPALGPPPSCEDRCSGRLLSSAAQSCCGPLLSSLPSSGRLWGAPLGNPSQFAHGVEP